MTVDDFLQFKAMMVRRNRDLTKEVLEAHGMETTASTARAVTDAAQPPGTPPRAEIVEAAEDFRPRPPAESSTLAADVALLGVRSREGHARVRGADAENEQREIERAIEEARTARKNWPRTEARDPRPRPHPAAIGARSRSRRRRRRRGCRPVRRLFAPRDHRA